jgi:hypothetical protein
VRPTAHRAHARWALWALLTLAGFTIMETAALRRHDEPATLSAAIRVFLGVQPRTWRRWLLVPVFLGFLCWFGTHILSEDLHTHPWER